MWLVPWRFLAPDYFSRRRGRPCHADSTSLPKMQHPLERTSGRHGLDRHLPLLSHRGPAIGTQQLLEANRGEQLAASQFPVRRRYELTCNRLSSLCGWFTVRVVRGMRNGQSQQDRITMCLPRLRSDRPDRRVDEHQALTFETLSDLLCKHVLKHQLGDEFRKSRIESKPVVQEGNIRISLRYAQSHLMFIFLLGIVSILPHPY
jgi:hypothetical protein